MIPLSELKTTPDHHKCSIVSFLLLLLVKDMKINELTWLGKMSKTLPYTPISVFVNFPVI